MPKWQDFVVQLRLFSCSLIIYLDTEPQLLIDHLHPLEVALHFSCSLDVLLHSFNVVHGGPENSALVPTDIPKEKTRWSLYFRSEWLRITNTFRFLHPKHSGSHIQHIQILTFSTFRFLVLNISSVDLTVDGYCPKGRWTSTSLTNNFSFKIGLYLTDHPQHWPVHQYLLIKTIPQHDATTTMLHCGEGMRSVDFVYQHQKSQTFSISLTSL